MMIQFHFSRLSLVVCAVIFLSLLVPLEAYAKKKVELSSIGV